MDWYTSTGGQYSSFSNTNGAYNYAPPSYNAYSTNFEDEPPLLEGEGPQCCHASAIPATSTHKRCV